MGITQRYKLCQKERDQDYCEAQNNKNKSRFGEGEAHISSLPRHDSSVLSSPCSLRSSPSASLPPPPASPLFTYKTTSSHSFTATSLFLHTAEHIMHNSSRTTIMLLLNNFLSANRDAIGLAFTS